MSENNYTTIRIKTETAIKLKSLRKKMTETYDDLIMELIGYLILNKQKEENKNGSKKEVR